MDNVIELLACYLLVVVCVIGTVIAVLLVTEVIKDAKELKGKRRV